MFKYLKVLGLFVCYTLTWTTVYYFGGVANFYPLAMLYWGFVATFILIVVLILIDFFRKG